MTETSGWDEFKPSLPIGSRVWCVVTRHEPFGVFVEISGIPFTGLVQITDFSDEGRMTVAEFPRLGAD